jgi:hypothetical protein
MKIINVIGYEGIYAVSDSGEVFNLKKGIKMKNILKDGYYCIILSKDGIKKNHRINRIVYESFKGRAIPNLVIDHIDGNKLNNHISNLRQITTRENTSKGHAIKSKYSTGVSYVKHLRKYKAEISISNVRYYLGLYDTEEKASIAYRTALNEWTIDKKLPSTRDRTKKYCRGCDSVKDIIEFYYVKNHGYTTLCKECSKKQSKFYRDKNKLHKEQQL